MFHFTVTPLALAGSLAYTVIAAPGPNSETWKNKALSPAERAMALLPTLEWTEKIAQLGGIRKLLDPNSTFNRTSYDALYPLQHGILSYGSQLNPAEKVLPFANKVRQEQMQDGKVPYITVTDSVNSIYVPGGTLFPATLSLSTTWDLDLYGQVAEAIRDENMALGTHWVLSPELDVAKDPRYGRVGETTYFFSFILSALAASCAHGRVANRFSTSYGEDVYLVGEFAAQYVRTMEEKDRNGFIKVATTVKHFLYGEGAGGINTASMAGGTNHLYNDLAPPYIRVLKENPASIMVSYSSIDRVPMSINKQLLQGMLRSEMGFEGLLMSDAMAIPHLHTQSLVASSLKDAATKALRAGLQLELAPQQPAAFPSLANSSDDREIVSLVDEAVKQHLIIKFATGMFDLPLPTINDLKKALRSSKHLDVNRKASCESIVLLQNNKFLPKPKISKVALLGPMADILNPGSYAPSTSEKPLYGRTLKGSLEAALGAKNVKYVKGVDIAFVRDSDSEGIQAAVAAAKEAGLAIVAIGSLSVYTLDSNAGERTDGEFFTHASLGFPGSQQQLIDAVLDAGVPTIVVLSGGQSFVLNNSTMRADAILHTFLAGEFTADSTVEIIQGKVNPSGKLTVTMPQDEGALPVYYDFLPSDAQGGVSFIQTPSVCATYDYNFPCLKRGDALMPFGYGLSYTTFDISAPMVTRKGDTVSISVTVANTGSLTGKEVVQVYQRPTISEIELPNKRLIRFQKVELKPGQSKIVNFSIPKNDLGYYNNAKYQVESREYIFWTGSSSKITDLKNATITL
ncbi:beta-glucosidase [Fusarium denticulatum]|uniref:beta-glucosidase n=1 Tax=Fusarium denticulatum TaxID=48507 RepID=A0A8H5XFL4_9HYPO|nr:beta-glucosidase [Fusarium denticulatum]